MVNLLAPTHMTRMATITSGIPNCAQSRKVIFSPAVLSMMPTAMALVGDPTSVPSPPIDAAKAMPMASAAATVMP